MFAVFGIDTSRRDALDVGGNEVDLFSKYVSYNWNGSKQYWHTLSSHNASR